jgi:hypothetical protein
MARDQAGIEPYRRKPATHVVRTNAGLRRHQATGRQLRAPLEIRCGDIAVLGATRSMPSGLGTSLRIRRAREGFDKLSPNGIGSVPNGS